MSEQEHENRPFHDIPVPKFQTPSGEWVEGVEVYRDGNSRAVAPPWSRLVRAREASKRDDMTSPRYRYQELYHSYGQGDDLQYFLQLDTMPVTSQELVRLNSQEQLAKMNVADLYFGIGEGMITNPDAIRVLLQKEREAKREELTTDKWWRGTPGLEPKGSGDKWHTEYPKRRLAIVEKEYGHVLNGGDSTLARFCAETAAIYMSTDYGKGHEDLGTQTAAKWYRMAARLAERNAQQVNRKTPPPRR